MDAIERKISLVLTWHKGDNEYDRLGLSFLFLFFIMGTTYIEGLCEQQRHDGFQRLGIIFADDAQILRGIRDDEYLLSIGVLFSAFIMENKMEGFSSTGSVEQAMS